MDSSYSLYWFILNSPIHLYLFKEKRFGIGSWMVPLCRTGEQETYLLPRMQYAEQNSVWVLRQDPLCCCLGLPVP